MKELAVELSVGDTVIFTGSLANHEVAQIMADAAVFVFPSIRDAGAAVIAEAMMAGLPVVAVNYGPGRHLLTDETGVRIPLGDEASHIRGFTTAMEDLVRYPERRNEMGAAAQDRARAILSWDARARKIIQVYEWVLGRRQVPPNFFEPEP